jgi:photosystem II protein
MSIGIQFISGMLETTTPVVKLTKSRNGNTGTATFIFYNPTTFRQWDNSMYPMRTVEGMYLVWDGKEELTTKDVTVIYNNGQPFLIRSICIFKTPTDWYHFLKFMDAYSKERGLYFAEENPFS